MHSRGCDSGRGFSAFSRPIWRVARRSSAGGQRGVGIVAVMMIVVALSLMGAVITMLVATGAVAKTNDLVREQAFYLANAGFEYALMRQSQGLDSNGTYNLGNGTFTIDYAQGGLITVSSSVNSMMGASAQTYTIQGPPKQSMGDCLVIGTSGAKLASGNTQLTGVTLKNQCSSPITIASMTVSWSPAISERMTQISIASATVYNNSSGLSSGSAADITDKTIAAGSTVSLDAVTFNGSVNGKNFTLLFSMSDASSTSASVQFVCSTQAAALYVDYSGANAGGTGSAYLQGITLYNACASPATIQINKITVSYTPTNRQTKLISIGGTTVYTSGGVASGTQVALSPAVQIASGTAGAKSQSIQSNLDLRGYNYTITYLMADNSSQTVTVNLYEQTPNACLNVINSVCSIGGTGSGEVRGQQWQNTCPLRIIVYKLRPQWTSSAKIKEVDANGVLRWTGGGSNSGTTLNFSNYAEIPGKTTWTVDRYLFNKSMSGQRLTSDLFTFYPGNSTFTYSATTCP